MSDMEYHTGSFKEICVEQTTFESKIRHALDVLKISLGKYGEVDMEGEYVASENLLYTNGSLYHVNDTEYEDASDMNSAKKLEDGTYVYTTIFYNGGCCLSEALEDVIKKAEKKTTDD